MGVSTELSPRGWMEQVKERGEPDTNTDSVEEDTITSGLGTEGTLTTTYTLREVSWSVMESLIPSLFIVSETEDELSMIGKGNRYIA